MVARIDVCEKSTAYVAVNCKEIVEQRPKTWRLVAVDDPSPPQSPFAARLTATITRFIIHAICN